MEYPVPLALAAPVHAPPAGPGWISEPKYDGHRTALWRTEDTVILQSRSGRTVTPVWMDIALAGMDLPASTVLDGEICIYLDGRLDFSAVQARAASTPARARLLEEQHPASYAVFDLLRHPVHGDVRQRPWRERRVLLEEIVAPLGPPIQVVPYTEDRAEAELWFEVLAEHGVEGLVWKRTNGRYEGGKRAWRKQRHTHSVDCEVVGYTGSAARPKHLAVRLPDGRTVLSQTLTGTLSAQIAARLGEAVPGRRARTSGGEPYTAIEPDLLVVEVAAGTTRHQVATVLRAL
ncbi:RNA ligase family protein [Streptomyces sp. BH097]|uniref:ATP-dependent DNA ligase n=1 Tax=unclassified Streptomyces TaxID=2593676 RepID=UPI003BB4B05F